MYKWKVVLILKNGQSIEGIHISDKNQSTDAIKELIPENYIGNSYISSLASENGDEQIFFRVEDVSIFKISAYYPQKVEEG